MKKEILVVPRGIRYISDWRNYRILDFPHIVNKQLTGCGFTEYCLTNSTDTIICSPRRILLENKFEQHTGDVFYFRNLLDMYVNNFDQDIHSPKVINNTTDNSENITLLSFKDLMSSLLNYIESRRQQHLPIKILVTYDSFRLVREFIEKSEFISMDGFQIIIDEFQSIFVDSRFKSDTEIRFLRHLQGLSKICFVSATPMLDHYLEMLDEFKDLPYYELDWASDDPGRIVKPNLCIKSCKSLLSEAKKVINSYLSGETDKYSFRDPLGRIVEIESREAVLYFNSVNDICKIIKSCNLTFDNTNVLCSRSEVNESKLQKAFGVSKNLTSKLIGSIPGKGEPHKMFTLCTRTVYLGADFYSTNAKSYIFSDPNIDSLAVDISLDLPQILGRQRLDINPWKNSATLFFKTTRRDNIMSRETFDNIIREKIDRTNRLLKISSELNDIQDRIALASKYEEAALTTFYKNDYVSVDRNSNGPFPVLNNLVMVSEMRAFDIQQVDYKDRFSVMNRIHDANINVFISNTEKIDDIIVQFNSMSNFVDKLKLLCTLDLDLESMDIVLNSVPLIFRNYYTVLGPERCRALSYKGNLLKEEYDQLLLKQVVTQSVSDKLLTVVDIGKKYPLEVIKKLIGSIYKEFGITRTPKASDIEDFLDVRQLQSSQFVDGKKKSLRVYEILGKK